MKLRAGALVAALALLAAGGWVARRAAAVNEAGWVPVTRGDLTVGAEISGVLKAARASILGPPLIEGMWEYKISFLAPEGTDAEAGTPVLAFDSSQLERQLLERRNDGEQAETELAQKSAELERRRDDLALRLAEAEAQARRLKLATTVPAELVAAKEADEKSIEHSVADREVEFLKRKIELDGKQAQAELAAVRGRRDRALSRVVELERDIGRLTVTAPRRGTVLYADDDGERKIRVGDTVWQGRVVLEIPDLSEMTGDGELDETDLGRVALGQPVSLTLDAFPDVEYNGRVAQIGAAITWRREGQPLKVVKVQVALDETDPTRMRPGMRFRGKVVTDRAEGALLLPLEAVGMTAEGPRVLRRRLLSEEEVRLELGRQADGKVEVLSGLAQGDRVRRP